LSPSSDPSLPASAAGWARAFSFFSLPMEDAKMGNAATIRAVLAILQWWGFNVTVIIINKWIFQVRHAHHPFLFGFSFLVSFFLVVSIQFPEMIVYIVVYLCYIQGNLGVDP
jgi:hypothetical protein